MRKIAFLIMLSFILLAACGTNDRTEPSNQQGEGNSSNAAVTSEMVGYVADIVEGRVLIVSNRLDEPYEEINIEQMYEKAGNAIYFSLKDIDEHMSRSLTIGEKVAVEHDAVRESYPGQSSAINIRRVLDEEYDFIDMHQKYSNINRLKQFLNDYKNGENSHLRLASYTIEGDVIYINLNQIDGSITVFLDETQDQFGVAEEIMNFSCSTLVQSFQEELVNIYFENCSTDEEMLALISIEPHELLIPEQSYMSLKVELNGEVIFETDDHTVISDTISKIKNGQKHSVATLSLLPPDGKLTVYGEYVDLIFDYYDSGAVIAHGMMIESTLIYEP